MKRTQFTFYESFKKAAIRLKKKADRADFYDAISDYALYGIEPNIEQYSDAVSVALELVVPVLNASRRKAESGKAGGSSKQSVSKTKANVKQEETESKKEGEKENKIEIENKRYPPNPLAAVMSAYMDKITPTPSEQSIEELKGYVELMGAECCLRAIDAALDAKVANWNYVRKVLQNKASQGVRCLADWDALEERRAQGGASKRPAPAEDDGTAAKKWGIKSAIDDCD